MDAVQQLLHLLKELTAQASAQHTNGLVAPEEELAEYSVGTKLKKQLLARRATRLANFLRLSTAGFRSPPPSSEHSPAFTSDSGAKPAAAQRLSHEDSAEEGEGGGRRVRKQLSLGGTSRSPGAQLVAGRRVLPAVWLLPNVVACWMPAMDTACPSYQVNRRWPRRVP